MVFGEPLSIVVTIPNCRLLTSLVSKTTEHQEAMMKQPDYPDMVAGLKPFLREGQMKMCHIEFSNDAAVAFTAPKRQRYQLSH